MYIKRIISLLSAFCIMFSAFVLSVSAEEASCGTSLTWRYDSDSRTLIIEGSGEMKSWRNSRLVPWREIREEAEHISLPNGLTTIGDYAFFKFKNLKEINIPSSVKSIGNGSLSVCSSLVSVTLPAGVESLGGWSFASCTALENIYLPSTLKTINYECFLNCPKLMDVTIPSSVSSISSYAFGYGVSHCYYYDMILRAPSGSPAQRYAAGNLLNFVSTNSQNTLPAETKTVLTDLSFNSGTDAYDCDNDGKITAKDLFLSYNYPAAGR